MRKITANYVFPVTSPPIKNGIIVIDEDDSIVEIIDNKNDFTEEAGLEYYNGVLVPGFINCHCHLELSHFKNKIEPGRGFVHFVKSILKQRLLLNPTEQVFEIADQNMYNNGIVGVGDISNDLSSFPTKKQSKIKYHNFIEIFGFDDDFSSSIESAELLYKKVLNYFESKEVSVTPHAPYSSPEGLIKKILQDTVNESKPVSFHHQESLEEMEFTSQQGNAMRDFFHSMGIQSDFSFYIHGDTSKWLTQNISPGARLLLVHNVYTTTEGFNLINNHFNRVYWCLCPNSNKFIMEKIPNIKMFSEKKGEIVLGTDSLASNTGLSILEEMKTIALSYPSLPFEQLLQWATLNGANFFGWENTFGSFEKGKSPGINLIYPFDFQKLTLNSESKVKRLT